MPSVRLASAIFIAGTAVLAFLAYRGHQSLVDYCEGSPEVAAGGEGLSCLEPQHWTTIVAGVGLLLMLEIGLSVVLGAAIVNRRRTQRT